MDIFSEMFVTGGNIGLNWANISSETLLCLNLWCQKGTFYEYIFHVAELSTNVLYAMVT